MEKITAEWGAGRGLARCFRGARISKDPPETTREATGQASVPPPQDWKEKLAPMFHPTQQYNRQFRWGSRSREVCPRRHGGGRVEVNSC